MPSDRMGSIFGGGSAPAPDPELARQRRALEAKAAEEKAEQERREANEKDARSRNLRGRRSLIFKGGSERGFELASAGTLSSNSNLGS